MRAVELAKKLLHGVLEAVFLQGFEFAQLVGLLAGYLHVRKAGFSQELEVKLKPVGEGITQETAGNLHRIPVVRGPQSGAEAVEFAFDLRGTAHTGAPVPGAAQQSDDALLALWGDALAAGEEGSDGDQGSLAVRLYDQCAAARQRHYRGAVGAARRRGRLRGCGMTGPAEHGFGARQLHVRWHQQGQVGALRVEERGGCLLQIVVAQRGDGFHVALAVVGVAVHQHVVSELTGDALVGFAGMHEVADDAGFRR